MSTGTPADDSAASASATHHHGPIRSIGHRLFFSTERRYQMFQTIVGGTIANLVAAGVIAAIAVAAGALTVSFSWSWSGYLQVLPGFALGFLIILAIVLLAIRRFDRALKLHWVRCYCFVW